MTVFLWGFNKFRSNVVLFDGISVDGPIGEALLLVGDPGVGPGAHDTILSDRLTALGLVVTLVDDDATVPDLSPYDLIVVSETCSSGKVNSAYDTAIPLLQMEVGANLSLNLGGGVADTDYTGLTFGTDITVLSTEHYITNFLSSPGDVTAIDQSTSFGSTANFGAGAVVLAEWPTDSNWKHLLTWDTGAELFDSSPAPARRVIYAIRNDPAEAAAHITAEGWTIFDRSVEWLLGAELGAGDPTGLPTAGWTIYE